MTRISRPRLDPDPPPKKGAKPGPSRVTRQRRERLNRDAEYLALRDIYLEENPECVQCGKPATQVHHIVGGVAGRARSLLNSDTWLGVCSTECYETIASISWLGQSAIKAVMVKKTIERLRR